MGAMMEEINRQMLATPPAVQIWMNWMMVIFFASVAFVWKKKAARYVLLTFLLTMPGAMVVFHFTQSVHLFGIPHIILWVPLLIYLVKSENALREFNPKSPYNIWMTLVCLTIVISVIFDVRDIYLVAIGAK